MTAAFRELETQFEELESDLAFVAIAMRLRPRLGDVVRWDVGGEVTELVRRFMAAKDSRPEGVYGPLLVRLLGAVERYFRRLIDHCIDQLASSVDDYAKLPQPLCNQNIKLTGRALAAIDEPRDHIALDTQTLIDNLASCKPGKREFRLNAQAFSAAVTGASPANLERALSLLNVKDWWDGIGRHGPLMNALGTKGTRATGDRARERLRELWKWRNHVAHGGDEQPALSEVQLREALTFLRAFTSGLDAHVVRQLKSVGG